MPHADLKSEGASSPIGFCQDKRTLGIDKNKSSVASRIIADTVERGFIKVSDEQNTSTKYVSYIPFYG